MPSKKKQPQIPLPKSWDKYVKSGILHVFALAQYALIYSRSWAADSSNQRVRLKAERDRWQQEAAQLCEAMRIKDARMAQLASFQYFDCTGFFRAVASLEKNRLGHIDYEDSGWPRESELRPYTRP